MTFLPYPPPRTRGLTVVALLTGLGGGVSLVLGLALLLAVAVGRPLDDSPLAAAIGGAILVVVSLAALFVAIGLWRQTIRPDGPIFG